MFVCVEVEVEVGVGVEGLGEGRSPPRILQSEGKRLSTLFLFLLHQSAGDLRLQESKPLTFLCVGRGERREDGGGDSVLFDGGVFFFGFERSGKERRQHQSVAHSERLVDGASARQNSFLRLGKGARHASRHRNALGDGREAGRRGVEHTAGDSSEKKRRGTAAVRGALGGGKLEGALLPFNRSRFGDVRERE